MLPAGEIQVLEKWKEAGAEGDPNLLRSLFLKQSLVPISATLVQVCVGHVGCRAYGRVVVETCGVGSQSSDRHVCVGEGGCALAGRQKGSHTPVQNGR